MVVQRLPKFSINGIKLNRVNEVTYLGIRISNDLSWSIPAKDSSRKKFLVRKLEQQKKNSMFTKHYLVSNKYNHKNENSALLSLSETFAIV